MSTYSHGQELFYKFVSNFTNKLVKQLLSMTVEPLKDTAGFLQDMVCFDKKRNRGWQRKNLI